MKWWDRMPWSSFSECWALSQLFHSSFTFIKRLFSEVWLLCNAIVKISLHCPSILFPILHFFNSCSTTGLSVEMMGIQIWSSFIFTAWWRISEKAMAAHSSTLAWKIPWMEEPGVPWSMGSLRVGHDWVTSLSLFTFLHWRRKWQPTPVFLPGESQGQWSLMGCRPLGRTESDTTKVT